jgi:hypothetical protein
MRRARFIRLGTLGALAALAVACSRTGLGLDDGELDDLDASFFEDGAVPGIDGSTPSTCVPTEETCNGTDDDCDGQVDEVPAIPCEEGGYQFCVAGSLSQCPKRCETCMPGTERVCFLSYCKYWGVQTCTADGKSWGKCREEDAPPECAKIAEKQQYSAALEQCCLDNGYCCVDEFDLDDDGSSGEMLGQCEEMSCDP